MVFAPQPPQLHAVVSDSRGGFAVSPKKTAARFKISTCVVEDSPGRLWASEKGSRFRILAETAEGVTVSAIFRGGGGGVTIKTL